MTPAPQKLADRSAGALLFFPPELRATCRRCACCCGQGADVHAREPAWQRQPRASGPLGGGHWTAACGRAWRGDKHADARSALQSAAACGHPAVVRVLVRGGRGPGRSLWRRRPRAHGTTDSRTLQMAAAAGLGVGGHGSPALWLRTATWPQLRRCLPPARACAPMDAATSFPQLAHAKKQLRTMGIEPMRIATRQCTHSCRWCKKNLSAAP